MSKDHQEVSDNANYFFFVCLLQLFGLDWNANPFLSRHCTWRGLSKGGNMECSKCQWHKHVEKTKPGLSERRLTLSFYFRISYE